jgi:tetratricopeptide (TPR) repeat protein
VSRGQGGGPGTGRSSGVSRGQGGGPGTGRGGSRAGAEAGRRRADGAGPTAGRPGGRPAARRGPLGAADGQPPRDRAGGRPAPEDDGRRTGPRSPQRAARGSAEPAPYPRRGTAAGQPRRASPPRDDRRPGLRIADEITADQLDPAARAELRTLPADLADSVARHLVASGLQEDAGQAYLYAKQARKLAARVGVVREACGIAAYRAGEWADALAELRAARRLTGRDSGLPLIADSERALGRLDRALAIVQGPQVPTLDRATQIELAIVESGIRRDQGMADAALLALQVPELTDGHRYPWSARLFYAYADALLDTGRGDEARDWFARSAAADTGEETDAAERFDELDYVVLEDLGEDEMAESPGEADATPEDARDTDVTLGDLGNA